MADIAQLAFQIDSSQARKASKDLDGLTAAATRTEAAAGRTERAMTATEKSTARMARSVDSATSFVKRLAGALLTIQAVRQVTQLADAYTNLTSKLRNVTDSEAALVRVRAQVYDIAQRTRQEYAATGELYARLTRATQGLGLAESERLRITETINKAAVVSGATAIESANAIRQLSQGLASGALRGEEFNSVAEQMPILLDMIAKSTGKSRGELRAMAADGLLTADVLVKAISQGAEEVDRQFGNMAVTIGGAMTVLENAFMNALGGADQTSEASRAVADAILAVADAIDIVAPQVNALIASWRDQSTEQQNVNTTAQDVAKGMKTVVTGLIIAKNGVDTLVNALKLAGTFMISWAQSAANTFDNLGTLIQETMTRFTSPIGVNDGLLDRFLEKERASAAEFEKSMSEGLGDFALALEADMMDVGAAFEFLNAPLEKTALLAADTTEGVRTLGTGATMTEEEVAKLAKTIKSMEDLLGRLKGEIDPVSKAWETYFKAVRDAKAIGASLIAQGQKEATVAKLIAQATKQAADNRNKEVDALLKKQRATQDLIAQMETELDLILMDERARNNSVAAMQAEEEMLRAIAVAREAGANITEDDVAARIKAARAIAVEAEEAERLQRIFQKFEQPTFRNMLSEIEEMGEAIRDAFGKKAPKEIAKMQAALGAARQEALLFATDAIGQGIDNLKSMADEGSKAYKALEVAQAATNVVAAIGAILNQGSGDPYTAFARMAAMAAAVGQLVGSIGAFSSGPGAESASARQARQGTGTVLGDAAADSASIANGVEITANATSKLVGISTGMLRALNAMQQAIGGASNVLARGANGTAPTSLSGGASIPSIGGANSHSLFVQAFANIFGGKESLRDTGIRIVGGTLSSMIDDIMVQSYATIHRSGGWFSSSRNYDRTADIGDEAATQFQLVLDSMATAVREGAEALGLNMAEVNAAIDAYRIEEIRISTMDLSAEEAQAELEAVFSSIFDGLAGSVVPFIRQFQQVGEGLGETLIRVATGVQVTQEAVRQLGFALDVTDPEQFAQISEGLIGMAGGIDAFISGMQTFVNAFGTEEHRFAIAQDEITRAFAQFGLAIPATRDGMWELMQSLDATTMEGQEQIAMLLRLAGVADSYYSMIEERQDEAAESAREAAQVAADAAAQAAQVLGDLMANMQSSVDDGRRAIEEFDMTPLARQLAQIQRETDAAMAAAGDGATDVIRMTIAMTGMERAINATRLAALEFTDQLEEWTFEDALTGMTELERELAQVDRTWQERYAQAIEIFGEGSFEAITVLGLWANATDRVRDSAAEAAHETRGLAASLVSYVQSLHDAQRTIAEILREAEIGVRGDGLTEQARAIKEINDRFAGFVRSVLATLNNPDLNPNQRERLQREVNEALIRLEELRLEALTNLEIEWSNRIREATEERYSAELDQIRHLTDFLNSMLLGTDSPLSAEERTAEAYRQLQDAVAAGNATEATRLADVYLRLLRESQASGEDFNRQWQAVRDLLTQMRDGAVESITDAATLQYLADIAAGGAMQLLALQRMNAALEAINAALGGPAIVGPVLPGAAGGASWAGQSGGGAEDPVRMLATELAGLREEVVALRADVRAGSEKVAVTVDTAAQRSDRKNDDSRARNDRARSRSER